MSMPIVDFTNPLFLITAIVLFVLCVILAKNLKTNTVPCIMLLVFITFLVGHTVEIAIVQTDAQVTQLAKCIVIDELFVGASYLIFLWLDKIQIEHNKKKKSKKGKKKDETVIENDGLDFLWKKV